jgi:hypothetical protein
MAEKKCNCKKTPLITLQNKIMLISVAILGTSIFGIVQIVKKLISLL